MTCTQCGHDQVTGKFCAKCGAPLTVVQEAVTPQEETVAAAPTQPAAPVQPAAAPAQPATPNQNVEQAKAVAKNYIGSFVDLLKKPNSGSIKDDLFVNGIISFVLLNLALGLMVTEFGNKFLGLIIGFFAEISGELGEVEDFLDMFLGDIKIFSFKYVFVFGIISAITGILVIAVIFFVNKLFIQERSFKSVFVSVTNYYPALIVLTLVSYLLFLVDFVKVGLAVAVFVSFVVYTIVPVIVLSRDMQNKTTKFDKFFVHLIAVAVILLVSYLVNDLSSGVLEDMIEKDSLEKLEDLEDLGDWW